MAGYARKRTARTTWATAAMVVVLVASASAQQMTLSRGGATVMVEPYAENIVRVSISMSKEDAIASAGHGISAKPRASGWTMKTGRDGDVLRSARMSVTVAPEGGLRVKALRDLAS
jgi:alpha-D-xyloside xylohydrolase